MTQIKYKSTVQRLIYIIGSLKHVRLPWVSLEVAGLSLLLLFFYANTVEEKRGGQWVHIPAQSLSGLAKEVLE